MVKNDYFNEVKPPQEWCEEIKFSLEKKKTVQCRNNIYNSKSYLENFLNLTILPT